MKSNHALCVLNCVEDAKSFLSEFQACHNEWTIVSTHGAVNDFFMTKGIACLELSSLITDDFLTKSFQTSDVTVKTFLKYLDKVCAQKISNILGIKDINYFYPLCVYFGKFEYLSIIKLEKALNVLFSQTLYKEVLVYQTVGESFFEKDDIFVSIIKEFLSSFNCRFELRKMKGRKNGSGKFNYVSDKFSKAVFNPIKTMGWAKERFSRYLPISLNSQKALILLIEPLCELSFLKCALSSKNVLIWPYQGLPRIAGIRSRFKEDLLDLAASELRLMANTLLNRSPHLDHDLFSQHIFDNFVENFRENVLPLLYLDQICKHYQIGVALWGSPPNRGPRALIVEYLLKNKIPVVGMQHGGNYVVQDLLDIHFDLDFSRCTHYFSYGFDEYDMEKTYPNKPCGCKIIPVGSYKEHLIQGSGESIHNSLINIDILFPITVSLSMFQEGYRVNGSQLNINQRKLIEYLESLSNMKVYIKPIPGYSEKTCSTIELFNKLKNARMLKDLTFSECLNRFNIRSVIMDFPSTPLFDAIGKDVDIFLLANPVAPFSFDALRLLKKRVHYFERIDELSACLMKFVEGELPALRNSEFYFKYAYRKNTKELILETIDGLMIQNSINYRN